MRRFSLFVLCPFFWGCGLETEANEDPLSCDEAEIGFHCEQRILEANFGGFENQLGLGELSQETYVITSVDEQSFDAQAPSDMSVSVDWPSALPFSVEEGDSLVFTMEEGWLLMTFPRGQLARNTDPFATLQPEFRLLDGEGTLERAGGCLFTDTHQALSARLHSQGEEAVLWPGEEAALGEWTYRAHFSAEGGAAVCSEGAYVWEPDPNEATVLLLLAHRAL